MKKPIKLEDILDQQNVISIGLPHTAKESAIKFFKDELNDNRPVSVKELFRSTNPEGFIVYEAYTDSGSDDYLYMIYGGIFD